jgi:uncharacterized protein (DUF427 family)
MIETARISIHPAAGTWVVRAGGAVIGESTRALELQEHGHEPVIYFPREDLAMAFLEPSETRSSSPFKGEATYWTIIAKSGALRDAGWSYEEPLAEVERIRGHIAFYADRVAVERI